VSANGSSFCPIPPPPPPFTSRPVASVLPLIVDFLSVPQVSSFMPPRPAGYGFWGVVVFLGWWCFGVFVVWIFLPPRSVISESQSACDFLGSTLPSCDITLSAMVVFLPLHSPHNSPARVPKAFRPLSHTPLVRQLTKTSSSSSCLPAPPPS